MAVAAGESPPAPLPRATLTLPELGPRAMRLFILAWSLMFVAAIAMPVIGAWSDFQQRGRPGWSALGIEVDRDASGIVIDLVHGAEARAAGVKAGDRILAVEGRPVPRGLGADDRARAWVLGPDGSPTRLTVAAPGRAPREIVLVRDVGLSEARVRSAGLSSGSYMTVVSGSGLAASLMLVVCSILLFRQRRRPVAALLSFGYLGVSAFALTGAQAIGPLGLWLVSAVVQSVSWVCILLALIAMPDGRFAPRWTIWLALLVLLNGLLDLTLLLPGGLSILFYVALTVAAVATLALRYRSLPSGAERLQLRWTFLGFAWGTALLVLGLIVQAFATAAAQSDPRWAVWSAMMAVPLFTLGFSAYALGLMISLLRYRLYDADAVIGRSAGYAVLTLLIAGTFGASAKLIEWLFETGFGQETGAVPGAIGAGLAIILITPMHNRILAWAERRFQKDLTELRRDLPELVGDMRETACLGALLDSALERIERGVHVTAAAVAINGETVGRRGGEGPWMFETPLLAYASDVPLAMLRLGPRPDGTPIGKDEREAVADIASPLARAIAIVQAREADQVRVEARADAIDRRLAALEAALAKPRRQSRGAAKAGAAD